MSRRSVAAAKPLSKPGSWALPARGTALSLTPEDFAQVAKQLGVEVAAVRAVSTVESGGRSGFDGRGRPLVRFETHYFQRLTRGAFDKSHPHLSCRYGAKGYWASAKNSWGALDEAFRLAPDEAVMSASWGMFQVMGEFHAMGGWAGVRPFVEDMFGSAGQHLRLFFGYCRQTGLARYLKAKQWTLFARRYNGPKYAKNHYDKKMKAAYERLSGHASRPGASRRAHSKGKR